MKGKIGPVIVKGKGWMSRMGLTCRSIEATVDQCSLDMNTILQKQKLILNEPAKGRAMVAFDAKDFGNFLTHPLMEMPFHRFNDMYNKILFKKDRILINKTDRSVLFDVEYLQSTWKCILQRASNGVGAEVKVYFVEGGSTLTQDEILLLEKELSQTITIFFNELIISLDKVNVSYQDMMVITKGKFPLVLISLDILVRGFPSRSVAF